MVHQHRALTREGGRDGIRQVLAMHPQPTAAVCYNDVVAFGAMSELGEHGLVVGRDFAITGFDGVAATAHSNPPLDHDGRAARPSSAPSAADMLLERLADPGSAAEALPSSNRDWSCVSRPDRRPREAANQK